MGDSTLIRKNSSGHSFPSRHVFRPPLSPCVCLPVVASAWNVLHAPISSISPCPSSWRSSLSQGCPRRLGVGTRSGEDFFAGLNEQIAEKLTFV